MAQASHDDNRIPTLLGVSSIDYTTPTTIAANPSTHAMLIDGTSLYASLDTRYLMLNASNDPLTGDLLIKPSTDSLTGFVVQDKDANNVLTVDTINNRVGVGTTNPGSPLQIGTAGYTKINFWNNGVGYGNPTAANTASNGDKITFENDGITTKSGFGAGNSDGLWVQASASLTKEAFSVWNGVGGSAPVERLSILGNGKMGINRAIPSSILQVEGSSTQTSYGAAATSDQGITVINSNNTTGKPYGIQFGAFAEYTFGGIYGVGTGLANNTAGDITFALRAADDASTSFNEVMRIKSGGNVGIGTTSPNKKLSINGPLSVFKGTELSYSDPASTDLIVSNSGGNARFLFGQSTSHYGGLIWNYNATVGSAYMTVQMTDQTGTIDQQVMTFLQNSNVGIGITAPTAKLHIVGAADTQQLIIKANATQTANILEIQNSSATVLSGFKQNGIVFSYGNGLGNTNFYAGNETTGNVGSSTGTKNVGIGSLALAGLTSGTDNMAIGTQALQFLTQGLYNVAIGTTALQDLVTGSNNTAIGRLALGNVTSSSNTGIGMQALGFTTSGGENVGIGVNTGVFNVTGQQNTIIGTMAGQGVSGNSHSNNTMIGYKSGFSITTGSSNIFLGNFSGDKQSTNSNLLIVDNQTRANVATEITNSILYGVMASTPASQTLALNAVVTTNGSVTSPNFISNIATGTAPIAVTSTTVNTNLNADMVDNLHSTDLPIIKQNVQLTAQVAAIGSTNISGTNTTGLYRVSYYLEDTTADITAGTIMVTIGWTDDAGATTTSSVALPLTAVGRTSGILYVRVLGTGSIQYSTTLVGIIGTSQYALFITAEKLL